ncbi:peroxiredoxin family protein [Halolamina salifodinae]|uniref:Peroxiredoxin n=1 Tax=Halolamina salifodinae TaxID=1202767 RepID=A0A8T4H031_9EURY|nr:peroxiredoxin family protein [Halolamina salifodinae]MBP1986955.1 peroxiredoxin [Halolamina salifodinae]
MSLEGSQAPEFELETTNGATVSLSETLADGPTVVSINRGHWCSFCAEQIATFSRVYEDLQFNHDVDVLPVVTSDDADVAAMKERFDYRFPLLADPDGAVAEQYSGTEQTDLGGVTGISAIYVVDEDGEVVFEHVAEDLTDRVYGNYIRYFVADEYGGALEDPGF